jgi:hypothetical protein
MKRKRTVGFFKEINLQVQIKLNLDLFIGELLWIVNKSSYASSKLSRRKGKEAFVDFPR